MTGVHVSELRFFEVCSNPDVVQGNDHEQALTRLDTMAQFDRFSSDHAAHRRVDFRVAQIKLSGVEIGAGLFEMPGSRVRLGACVGNLLGSDTGRFDLCLALNDEAARFGDLLFD